MPWKYLEDEAIADIGIRVEAENLSDLFKDAVLSIAHLMTNIEELEGDEVREIKLEAASNETLLYQILDEMIYLKDADLFFVKQVDMKLEDMRADVTFTGTIFDRERHAIGNDIKAITLHDFYIRQEENKWIAHYIIDI